MIYNGLLHKYGHLLDLPSHAFASAVSLLEGNTPLIKADSLSHQLGGGFDLFIKYEGLNPTGSFKDRGMTAAVSEALGRNATTVICASTGNTAASAAAYAARAGMKSIVLIPQGKVATGKLAGAIAVPIDYRSSREFTERIRHIVAARIVITGDDTEGSDLFCFIRTRSPD